MLAMRTLLRHLIALFLVGFICKIAIQAKENGGNSGVPKALLLGRIAPQQPLPSGRIDDRQVVVAIEKQ